MYKEVLDKNWIRDFFRSIGDPTWYQLKPYECNKVTKKRVLACIIITQARSLDFLITALHEIHLKKNYMVDTRSNMQLADLKSNPHGRKSIRKIIDSPIVARLYPSPGSAHYKLLCLDKFYGPCQINCDKKKKS